MRVVLIDDEKAMHLILKRMLAKIGDGIEIAGSFTDTASAEAFLSGEEVDMVFVDIQMPRDNGFAFAQRLRERGSEVRVVFVTSHTAYALPAYDLYAYDYMVKPVVQERLQKTVLRAMAELGRETSRQESAAGVLPQAQINCLGRMEIRSSTLGLVKWKSSKSAELCAYLLLQRGSLVSRARLIEDIFGGKPLKNAEIYLNTTAYQLRKLLDTVGLKGSLHSDPNHYALDLSLAQVDMVRFEEECRELASIDESNLEQALELERMYAGSLFGDLDYPWAWSEVERLSLLYSGFAQRLCVALLNLGDASAALLLLGKLSLHNELDEETFRLEIRALVMQHNREGLIRRYKEYELMLREELGVGPSMEINQLYAESLDSLNERN